MTRSRFAPSTTGEAHPGTFLSALLVVLDARARGLETVLRFENLDPQRCRPEYLPRMRSDLQWLGLEFDHETVQSERRDEHEQALDLLAERGALYPCSATRSELKAHGVRAPDGAWSYPNLSRGRPLPANGWRRCEEPLRARLPDRTERFEDESGEILELPLAAFGDPVVRRRDGAIAYQLASVVDDEAARVSRVVRGRDLLASTLVQNGLRSLLGLSMPAHRHHFLLLERSDSKLSKLHGAIGAAELRAHYRPEDLLGVLAFAAELIDRPEPVSLHDLELDWPAVRQADRVVEVEAGRLVIR